MQWLAFAFPRGFSYAPGKYRIFHDPTFSVNMSRSAELNHLVSLGKKGLCSSVIFQNRQFAGKADKIHLFIYLHFLILLYIIGDTIFYSIINIMESPRVSHEDTRKAIPLKEMFEGIQILNFDILVFFYIATRFQD